MNKALEKAINNQEITDEDIKEGLYEVCEDVHSSCDYGCPIYSKFNGEVPKGEHGCKFFKNGEEMLKELRRKQLPTITSRQVNL